MLLHVLVSDSHNNRLGGAEIESPQGPLYYYHCTRVGLPGTPYLKTTLVKLIHLDEQGPPSHWHISINYYLLVIVVQSLFTP